VQAEKQLVTLNNLGSFGQGVIHMGLWPSKCLHISEETFLQIWDCEPGNQRMMFELAGEPTGPKVIRWAAHPEQCLQVQDDQPRNGNGVQVGLCRAADGAGMQRFYVPADFPGHTSWMAHPEKCLDVANPDFSSTPVNGHRIQVWDCYPENVNQKLIFNVPDWVEATAQAVQHVTISPLQGSTPAMLEATAQAVQHVTISPLQGSTPAMLSSTRSAPLSAIQATTQMMPVTAATPGNKPPGLLFCLSLMLPHGGEEMLMKTQLEHGNLGIFGCDDSAVYSNMSIQLSSTFPYHFTDVMPGSLVCPVGGPWHSALNTGIFVRFWEKVLSDKRTWMNEWTVKVDPDAVFFPERLRKMVKIKWPPLGQAGHPTFLNNCHLGNHGPLAVLNKYALGVYKDRRKECTNGFEKSRPQEDLWFRDCLKTLSIPSEAAYNLLYETAWACDENPSIGCWTYQVAFHPFKDTGSYMGCHDAASKHPPESLYPSTQPNT